MSTGPDDVTLDAMVARTEQILRAFRITGVILKPLGRRSRLGARRPPAVRARVKQVWPAPVACAAWSAGARAGLR